MKKKTKKRSKLDILDTEALRPILGSVTSVILFCNKKDAKALETQVKELDKILTNYEALVKEKRTEKNRLSLNCLSMALQLMVFALQMSFELILRSQGRKRKPKGAKTHKVKGVTNEKGKSK